MKKLMVIATVALAAVSLNAATIKWTAGQVYDPTGTQIKGAGVTFYAFFTSVAGDPTAEPVVPAPAVKTVADAAAAAAMIAKGDLSAVAASGSANALGAVSLTSAAAIGDLFVTGTSFDGIIIAMTSDNSKYLDLGGQHKDVLNGASTVTVGLGNIKNAAGDWQTVPEPTSGLLLLLGVAGLALRRRRA